MRYKMAMEAAGASVLAYKEFGSYQGDWWAYVLWNGNTGWVHGAYGSCDGCDSYLSYLAEFEGLSHEGKDGVWHSNHDFPIQGCSRCAERQQRLADFGRKYLDDMQDDATAITQALANISWDHDAEEMCRWMLDQMGLGDRGVMLLKLALQMAGELTPEVIRALVGADVDNSNEERGV